MRISRTVVGLSALFFAAACGGSKPEAKEPEASSSESSESSEAPSKDSKSDDSRSDGEPSASNDSKASESEGKEKEKEKKPARSAKDAITRPDVLFMFSFNASEPHQAAEKKCAEKSGDDPKKKADCMTKASKAFDSDGIAFKETDGKWWWLTIRRKGTSLETLHKIEIDFGDDGENRVVIKPHGPDKGKKPMGSIPKELVIESPSDSEIAIVDPKQGRLVYEAKMGLMGNGER